MFDIKTSIMDEYGEEVKYEALCSYIDEIMNEFAASPEAREFEDNYDRSVFWAVTFMEYAGNYFGENMAEISPGTAEEIIFDIFPRKVSVDACKASDIITELRAFWEFLKRTRSLKNADTILEILTDRDAEELEVLLGDSSNFGMAKSFVMFGKEAGFDMTNEHDAQLCMLQYNAALMAQRQAPHEVEELPSEQENYAARVTTPTLGKIGSVGRNEPCPCGSGRKYKKCCGKN